MNRLLILVSILTLFGVNFVSAQEIAPGIEEQVSIQISPSIPGPNEETEITATSFLTDLNKAEISWYENGILLESGVGLRKVNFKTGDLGDASNIRISIKKYDGNILEKTLSITPAEVDLFYEAFTHTPPFYKGKSIITFESDVKFVAIPNFLDSLGRKVSPKDVSYKWSINGTVDLENSGVGKDSYIYNPGINLRPIDVLVEATPILSDQKARAIETINFKKPFIAIYEKNPIFGTIFERAISGDFMLNRTEVEFEVVPYFFSDDIFEKGSLDWLINGEKTAFKDLINITFRRTDDSAGTAQIGVEITHNDKLLQKIKTGFNLFFEEGGNDFNF